MHTETNVTDAALCQSGLCTVHLCSEKINKSLSLW